MNPLWRSTRDVLDLVHDREQKGAGLRVLEPEFCTSTDPGRILVTVLGMVAEMARVHSRPGGGSRPPSGRAFIRAAPPR
ncbi:MAG TPA: recombinase family protein [Xanthobacteraceae bacterium]|nr:recombinase family protein [Xanthobacteraceae bacterium]